MQSLSLFSKDDLSLLRKPDNNDQQRARSNSPVKQRRSMFLPETFEKPYIPYTNKFDANLSPEQLLMLSKSPISKKLHITSTTPKSKYVIPVPFTLQLPPKLSPKNLENIRASSPDRNSLRSRSPHKVRTTLIYTANGYNKLDSDPDDDQGYSEEEIINRIALPRRPIVKASPPPVVTNNTKSSKIVAKSNYDPHDELSIIEEVSTAATSRQSSLASEKTLPPIPNTDPQSTDVAPSVPEKDQKTDPTPKYTNIKIISNPESSSPKRRPPPPLQLQKPETEIETESLHPEVPSVVVNCIPKVPIEDNLRKVHKSNAPTEADNVNLKISKRTFSDESHVSSVSSFSSVGDFMNFSRFATTRKDNTMSPTPFKAIQDNRNRNTQITQVLDKGKGNNRIVSNVSQTSNGSNDSWESIQESIDISISEYSMYSSKSIIERLKASANEKDVATTTTEVTLIRDNNEDQEDSSDEQLETEPLTPITPTMNTTTNSNNERLQLDKDNGGAGKGFNFPNNSYNITNSPEIKNKNRSNSIRSERSRFSFISRDGHIEIPDLTTQSISDTYSSKKSVSSYDGISNGSSAPTEYSVTDPIAINVKPMNEYNHNFAADMRLSKSTPWSLNENIQTQTPNSTSPVRHTRHKSMHNIDFEINSQTSTSTSLSKHSRSRSMDLLSTFSSVPMLQKAVMQPNPQTIQVQIQEPKQALQEQQEPQQALPEQQEEQGLSIQIEEPPLQVRYEVDFKDATSHEDSRFNDNRLRAFDYKDIEQVTNQLKKTSIDNNHNNNNKIPHRSPSISSDTESVLIDLTDEEYDVTMINRNNSTTSYRSIIEKTKEGKPIEVVLVEDEDDTDLLSIYSKYRNNAFIGIGRNASISSTTSSTTSSSNGSLFSSASYDSVESTKQLKVVPSNLLKNKLRQINASTTRGTVIEDISKKRSNINLSTNSSNTSTSYTSRRIKPPPQNNTSIPPPPTTTKKPALLHPHGPKQYTFSQGQTFLN
ncbi:uncharacterized protein RJT21DRAFT_6191 [Scheffersomyces amazonensis]|uniref:uncharacterized protein n=1 Tax=Scheffersomyces amazonensis TaxID=1078765 RepID=UPI00315C554E